MDKHYSKFANTWPIVGGLRIHTRSSTIASRVAPTVVLIHGLGVSARYLAPTAEHLARDCHVWIPELPGFGQSDKPKTALNISEMASVLIEWLSVNSIPRAAFLGNSMGCQVIVDLALRSPQCVHKAILVAPTVDTVDRTLPRQLWRGLRDLMGEPWSPWPILAADYFEAGTRRIYQTCRYALADPVEIKLPCVNAPCLVVRGTRDTLVPQRWIDQVAALLPNCESAVIQGATHAANYSAPIEVARLTLDFLNG